MYFALVSANGEACRFGARAIWALIISMIVAITFLGNLELGVNSYGDLIFGALLGIWTVCVSHFIIRQLVIIHTNGIFLGKSLNPDLPVKKYMLLSGSACLAYLLITLSVAYLIKQPIEAVPFSYQN